VDPVFCAYPVCASRRARSLPPLRLIADSRAHVRDSTDKWDSSNREQRGLWGSFRTQRRVAGWPPSEHTSRLHGNRVASVRSRSTTSLVIMARRLGSSRANEPSGR